MDPTPEEMALAHLAAAKSLASQARRSFSGPGEAALLAQAQAQMAIAAALIGIAEALKRPV